MSLSNFNLHDLKKRVSPEKLVKLFSALSDEEATLLQYQWSFWARPQQLPPPLENTTWITWLILAGRGFGKTRSGAEWVRHLVENHKYRRIALVAEDAGDARDVMIEGESGIMAVCPPWNKPTYEPSKKRLTWPNGARATIYSADDPEALRGPQHDAAWLDELCLVADTMIETATGPKPIQSIKPGDLVWTRKGLKPVIRSWKTKDNAELYSNGIITGTAGHPVFTPSGFKPLHRLLRGDTIAIWQNLFYIRAADTINGAGNTKIDKEDSLVEQCGKMPMGLFQKASTYTTKTAIRLTTVLKTSSVSADLITSCDTNLEGSQPRTLSGEETTLESMFGTSESLKHWSVASVAVTSSPPVCEQSTAVPIVRLEQTAASVKLDKKAAVYNIEVEDCNEYFANGLLVHNCKWRYQQEAWDQLQFGLRLGKRPVQCITTTPKPTKLLKEIINRPSTLITRGHTYDNLENLASSFREAIVSRYEGTRLGRQELNAEILDDNPNALFHMPLIEAARKKKSEVPEDLHRTVVAVDPPTTGNDKSDECGIVVVSRDIPNINHAHFYVHNDASVQGRSPESWAATAISQYYKYQANAIVAEINQGGDMVESVIRSVDPTVRVIKVRASKGKWIRAEPIAGLYEQGRVHHVGSFPKLEDQMCDFDPSGTSEGRSPDRMDALVWGLAELSNRKQQEPRIRVL